MIKRLLPLALVSMLAVCTSLGAETPRLQINCKSPVTCVAWSAKGDLLAAGCADGAVHIFDVATGKELHSWIATTAVTALAFSPDGRTMALGHGLAGPSVSLWNVQTGNPQKTSTIKNYNPQHVAFSADGQSVNGVSLGKFFQMKITGSLSGSTSTIAGGCSAMAADGSSCAYADANGLIRFRQCDPPPLKQFNFSVGRLRCLAIGPQGKLIATGGPELDVHLWDVAAKRKVSSLTGLTAPPVQLAYSADGSTLAAVAADNTTIRVWDLTRNNHVRRQISHNRGDVGALVLSPNGKLLATTGPNGKALLIWNVATRDLTHNGPPLKLTPKELADLWTDLADKNYDKADTAWHKLGAAGDYAVPFLKEKIWPIAVPAVDMAQIEKWVAELDATKFALREKATKELMSAGEMAIVPLKNVLKKHPSEEAVLRAKMVLKQLTEPVLTPERLRVLQVIELLEAVRTGKARSVLEEIGREARIAQIQEEAAQALKRMGDVKGK